MHLKVRILCKKNTFAHYCLQKLETRHSGIIRVSGNDFFLFLICVLQFTYLLIVCFSSLYLIILFCVTAVEDDVALTSAGDIDKSRGDESPVMSDNKWSWLTIGLLTGLLICAVFFIVILMWVNKYYSVVSFSMYLQWCCDMRLLWYMTMQIGTHGSNNLQFPLMRRYSNNLCQYHCNKITSV